MGLPNGNIVTITWLGLCFGQEINYSQNYVVTADFSEPTPFQDLENILSAVQPGGAADQTTAYLGMLAPQYSLQQIRVQNIWPVRTAYASVAGGNLPGTDTNAATVANDSAAFTQVAALAGRRYVATKKIGPIGDGARTGGGYSVPYLAKLITFANFTLNDITVAGGTGGTISPCIYHRKQPGTNDRLVDVRVIDTARVHRRRTVGIGA